MKTALNEVFRDTTEENARAEAELARMHPDRRAYTAARSEAERAMRNEFARRIFL
ncbi:hypothetical protein GQE99_03370 [Maritimibacter sp. DP07]|uniref:Uncharacterized protein n=1 Tax=Maritimibacter harenae TaxID=2606218 RepID=A0A845LXF9_9RHOB|nr:hypothetical protein [Maritimibacter harenae]MZR12056.1 hypothetical protein [Maritimibacter harenae]